MPGNWLTHAALPDSTSALAMEPALSASGQVLKIRIKESVMVVARFREYALGEGSSSGQEYVLASPLS